MSTTDREATNSPAEADPRLPIEDLSPAAPNAKTAEQVKGGLGQLHSQAALSSVASTAGSAESSK